MRSPHHNAAHPTSHPTLHKNVPVPGRFESPGILFPKNKNHTIQAIIAFQECALNKSDLSNSPSITRVTSLKNVLPVFFETLFAD